MSAKTKMYLLLLLARERSEPIALNGIGTPLLRRYDLSGRHFQRKIEECKGTVTVFQMESELPGLIRRFLAGEIL